MTGQTEQIALEQIFKKAEQYGEPVEEMLFEIYDNEDSYMLETIYKVGC